MGTAAFVVYETLTFLGAARLVALLTHKLGAENEGRTSEWVLATLFTTFVIRSTTAFILTFVHLNVWWTYLGAAAALVAALYGLKPRRLLDDLRRYLDGARKVDGRTAGLLALCLALLAPILIASIKPIEDTDSIVFFNPVISWFLNRTTPYDLSMKVAGSLYPYSQFWELTYLPSLAINHGIYFMWWDSLQAVAAVFLGGYALARRLRLQPASSLMVAAAGIAQAQFWWLASGVSTIKTDMLQAAGYVTLALGAARLIDTRNRGGALTGLLIFFGLVGLTVKYSGPVPATIGIGLLAVFCAHDLLRSKRNVLLWVGVASVGLLATNGHYYVRNWVVFSNPVWPAKVVVLGHTVFEGTRDTRGTSIAAHALDLAVLQDIFTWMRESDPILPVTFEIGLALPAVYGLIQLASRRNNYRPALARDATFLLAFAWIGWISFIATPTSAQFLYEIVSLRFATGVVLITEILLLYLLSGVPGGSAAGLAVAAVAYVARLEHLYYHHVVNGKTYLIAVLVAALIAVGVLAALSKRFQSIWVYSGLLFMLGLLILAPFIIRFNQQWWLGYWKPAWEQFADRPGTRIGLVGEPWASCGSWETEIVVSGLDLQNEVVAVDESLTDPKVDQVDYLVRLQDPNCPNLKLNQAFAQRAAQHSFTLVVVTDYVVVARH